MNIQLKQRLVGAAVLVALAVIFIPMILPGEGDLSGSITSSNIPSEPDFRFPAVTPVPAAPAMAKAPIVPMREKTESNDVSQKRSEEAVDHKDTSPLPKEKPPKLDEVEKPRAKSITTAISIPPVSSSGKQNNALKAKANNVSGWVVQVGSFSKSQNAISLRNKLRKLGHATFVEKIKGSSGTVYRVRVGPELTRKSAENLTKRLFKQVQLKGLVQSYP